MLDAYSSIGMPLFYKHWSFGKHFAQHEALYRKGMTGLAYEIVINSSPCISYLMEENSATMQALVIAHAAFGHNHFFKNNYVFKQWTDAEGILDYLNFAKGYVTRCEERNGPAAVERTLDAAHALMSCGVDRYPGKKKLDLRLEERRTLGNGIPAQPWTRLSSPTLLAPPKRQPTWATGAGTNFWTTITPRYGAISFVSAGGRSTPPATASSPPSMGRPVLCNAPAPSRMRSSRSDLRFAPAFIPENAK